MEIGEIKFLSWSLLRRYFIFENTVERLKSSRDYLFFFLNVQERINEIKKFHKPRKIIEFRRRYKNKPEKNRLISKLFAISRGIQNRMININSSKRRRERKKINKKLNERGLTRQFVTSLHEEAI